MDVNPLNNRRDQTLNLNTQNKQPSLGNKPVVQLSTRTCALPSAVTEQISQDVVGAPSLRNRCHSPKPEEYPQMPDVRA